MRSRIVALSMPFLRDAEGLCDHAEHVIRVELGRDDIGRDIFLAVELVEQTADQGGLAGADITL